MTTKRFQVQFETSGEGRVTGAITRVADATDTAADSARDFDAALGGASKRQEQSILQMNRMESATRAAGAVLGAAFVGSLVLMARNSIQAEQEQAQLAAALRSTGEAAGYSQAQLNAMAAQLEDTSIFSAGEINDAQTRLLSYSGIVGEQFPRALQLAIDQSVRLGETLTQSAETVGKALEYPAQGVSALTEQGFRFTDQQKEMLKALEETGRLGEAQAIVMEVMEESYAGAAQAARDTLGGALAGLTNSFEDLLTGDSGSSGIQGSTAAINDLSDTLNDPALKEGFQTMFSGAMTAVAGLARLATTTASVTKFLAESAASAVQGPSADDLVRVEDRIGRIKRVMDDLRTGESNPVTMSGELAGIGLPSDRALELNADYIMGRTGSLIRKLNEELLEEENKLQLGVTLAEDAAVAAARIAAEANAAVDVPARPLPTILSAEQKAAAEEAKRAAEALERAHQSLSSSLAQEIALFGEAGRAAKMRYELENGALQALSPLRKQALQEQAEWLDWLEEMAVVEQAWGDVAAEQAQRVIDSWDEAASNLTVFAEQAGRNMQDAFADFLFDPFEDGLDGMAKSFAQIIQRMVAEWAAAEMFAAAGKWGQKNAGSGGWQGVLGSIVGGMFGGGRAAGGSVDKSRIYEVGEGGNPELLRSGNGKTYLIPGSDGTVIPARGGSAAGEGVGARGVVVNIHGAPSEPQVNVNQGADGLDIEVIFKQMEGRMASNVAGGTGPLYSASKGRFGLRDAI